MPCFWHDQFLPPPIAGNTIRKPHRRQVSGRHLRLFDVSATWVCSLLHYHPAGLCISRRQHPGISLSPYRFRTRPYSPVAAARPSEQQPQCCSRQATVTLLFAADPLSPGPKLRKCFRSVCSPILILSDPYLKAFHASSYHPRLTYNSILLYVGMRRREEHSAGALSRLFGPDLRQMLCCCRSSHAAKGHGWLGY